MNEKVFPYDVLLNMYRNNLPKSNGLEVWLRNSVVIDLHDLDPKNLPNTIRNFHQVRECFRLPFDWTAIQDSKTCTFMTNGHNGALGLPQKIAFIDIVPFDDDDVEGETVYFSFCGMTVFRDVSEHRILLDVPTLEMIMKCNADGSNCMMAPEQLLSNEEVCTAVARNVASAFHEVIWLSGPGGQGMELLIPDDLVITPDMVPYKSMKPQLAPFLKRMRYVARLTADKE